MLKARPENYGGRYRARTYDPLLVRQMLSQLSYAPKYNHNVKKYNIKMVAEKGLEPLTLRV